MNDSIRKLIAENNVPRGFVIYSYFTFLPVAVYPLFLFASIFLFDHPSSLSLIDWLIAATILSYPLFLYWFFKACLIWYPRFKFISYSIPIVTTAAFIFGLISMPG